MMKKEYVKPEMVMEEILLEAMIATSIEVEEGEDDGRGANDRRGGWGDLWN